VVAPGGAHVAVTSQGKKVVNLEVHDRPQLAELAIELVRLGH
jgi:hypothetical protein